MAWGCTATVIGDPNPGASEPGGGPSTAGSGNAGSNSNGSAGSNGNGAGGAPSGGFGTMAASDLPCNVQALLAQKCQICHRADPPGALLESADFRRPSRTSPSQTVAQNSLARLKASGAERMPPAPLAPVTADELAAFESFVASGAAASSCSNTTAVGPDPYDTPLVCTSMSYWTGGDRESPLMHPGGACIACHTREREGPTLSIAGTVYPTPHEPDDCNGVDSASGARVVITDANGAEASLQVNSAGNFFIEGAVLATPYRAKVVYQGRERVMVEAQTDGDCNGCHTQDGAENAPGRIFLP
jgi:mono/diheme cytochrome c family protein